MFSKADARAAEGYQNFNFTFYLKSLILDAWAFFQMNLP